MGKELTYSLAFAKLEELVGQLEEGDIQLDKLTAKVNQANELIAICERKLRTIEGEVKKAAKTGTTLKKGKTND